MTKELDIMEGDLETGLYREQCGYHVPVDIAYALTRQASGENCDGDPYESMVFAAKYIEHLRKHIATLRDALSALVLDVDAGGATLGAMFDARIAIENTPSAKERPDARE